MPSAARQLLIDPPPRFTMAELIEVRRNILRYARALPPGSERNGRRQVALSLRELFKSPQWLEANLVKQAAGISGPMSGRAGEAHKAVRFSRHPQAAPVSDVSF